jgi:hypothetical protein
VTRPAEPALSAHLRHRPARPRREPAHALLLQDHRQSEPNQPKLRAPPRFRPLAAAARGDNVLRPFQGLQKGERKLPDIWTEHPEIVRDLLREAGLTCGVEPRILKGRDPDWTCILDGKNIAGDIYIHQADTILGVGMAAVAFALLGVLLVVVIVLLWQAWVISRLKRKLRSS